MEMVTEFQKKIVESSSHERLKSDFYAMLQNEEAYKEEIRRLEEENKKLNIIIENTKIEQKSDRKHIEELEEENKNLKEKVRFLEECLDRKEKLNEKYRKEIDELKSTYVYDAKQVRDIC